MPQSIRCSLGVEWALLIVEKFGKLWDRGFRIRPEYGQSERGGTITEKVFVIGELPGKVKVDYYPTAHAEI